MSGLMQLRDALELMGQADARVLSLRLRLPQAMAAAMLERLEMMGQAERVTGDDTAAGACRACSRSAHCRLPCYRLRSPAA
ncbi:MAG: FeoC-like transcriptional regulator [Sodalis sp. (in: enterobacteria)]|uniref:FeoC-like transcriptional regulator n=1 Tax=Sodalis sp. (in: enterobacteria) TaxID=1898979 RepID=UPI0039E50FAF